MTIVRLAMMHETECWVLDRQMGQRLNVAETWRMYRLTSEVTRDYNILNEYRCSINE